MEQQINRRVFRDLSYGLYIVRRSSLPLTLAVSKIRDKSQRQT